jgi:hypothetical protein
MIIDEYSLNHAGIKGMKWGVRKSGSQQTTSPKNRLSEINKKLDKFDANRIVGGAGTVGYYQKRRVSQHPYGKAKVRIALRGAAEAAVLLGGGTLVAKKVLGASPMQLRGAQLALGLLAVKEIGLTRVSEIHNVNVYKKHTQLINEKRAIEAAMKKRR